jgi:hypothetical protein
MTREHHTQQLEQIDTSTVFQFLTSLTDEEFFNLVDDAEAARATRRRRLRLGHDLKHSPYYRTKKREKAVT